MSFQSPKMRHRYKRRGTHEGLLLRDLSQQIREGAWAQKVDANGQIFSCLILQGRWPSSLFWRFGLSLVCFTNGKGWHRKCNWLTQSHTASQWPSWGKNPLLLSPSSNASTWSKPLAPSCLHIVSPPHSQLPRYVSDHTLTPSRPPVLIPQMEAEYWSPKSLVTYNVAWTSMWLLPKRIALLLLYHGFHF